MTKHRKVGDPFDPATEQGPQVSDEQFQKVMSYIDAGKREGAQMLCGGKRVGDKRLLHRADDLRQRQRRHEDRPRGDLRPRDERDPVQDASTKSSAVPTTRRTAWPPPSGPATSRKAHAIANRLRAGTVWVNCYDVFDAAAPFGGFKMSGIGRELGEYGLQNYTEVKTVTVKI